MKAKSGYTGLEGFPLSFSKNSSESLKMPGNDVKMGAIHDLFDSGNDEEARKMLRKALADISQNLDTILRKDATTSGEGEQAETNLAPSLSLSLEM